MAVKSFFLPQGMIIGEVTLNVPHLTVKNPALVITRQNDVILAPFLQLVEETEIKISIEDVAFKQIFTPKTELVNHYNQIYGSGLVVTNTLKF